MDKQITCEITKELLLSYADGLLKPNVKQFVEEHILECNSCKEELEIIKEERLLEKEKRLKKDVIEMDFLKKVNRKMNIFKSIVLFIGVVIGIYICIIGYRYSVLSRIYNSDIEEQIGNNSRITMLQNGEVVLVSYYKDGIMKTVQSNGDFTIWASENEAYWIDHRVSNYLALERVGRALTSVAIAQGEFEIEEEEPAAIRTIFSQGLIFRSNQDANTRIDILRIALRTSVRRTTVDGRAHYVIRLPHTETLWVDQETSFVRKTEQQGHVTESIVEINVVTDEIIMKPNTEGYSFIYASNIGRINIPSINVNYPILSVTTDVLLEMSPTRFGEGEPNEVGNLVITAHNYGDTRFFGRVPTLNIGDIIEITDLTGRTLQYAVYYKTIVCPTNIGVLDVRTPGKIELTLITSTNDTRNRWIIQARAVL